MPPRTDSHRVEWTAAAAILALLLIFAIPWSHLFGPERSVTAYCQTWQTEGQKLRARYGGADGNFVSASIALMGAPDDLADLFDKLEKVAPSDIEPDVKRYRDAWKEIADSYRHGGLLDMLATQMVVAAQVKGAEDRIDNWTQANCTANTK